MGATFGGSVKSMATMENLKINSSRIIKKLLIGVSHNDDKDEQPIKTLRLDKACRLNMKTFTLIFFEETELKTRQSFLTSLTICISLLCKRP